MNTFIWSIFKFNTSIVYTVLNTEEGGAVLTPCSYGESSAFVRLECPPLITVYHLACGEEESSWAQANNDEVEQRELGLTHLYTGK